MYPIKKSATNNQKFINLMKYIIDKVKNNTKCSYKDIETIFNLNEIRKSDRTEENTYE